MTSRAESRTKGAASNSDATAKSSWSNGIHGAPGARSSLRLIRLLNASPPAVPVSESDLEEIERATILRVFEQVKGDKTLAGKILGISRATLYRKLKRYGIGESRTLSASAQ